jgi:hypothetical protein
MAGTCEITFELLQQREMVREAATTRYRSCFDNIHETPRHWMGSGSP